MAFRHINGNRMHGCEVVFPISNKQQLAPAAFVLPSALMAGCSLSRQNHVGISGSTSGVYVKVVTKAPSGKEHVEQCFA